MSSIKKANKIELFSPNTFGFSFLIAEAWFKSYKTYMLRQVGKTFSFAMIFKDPKGIHWFRDANEQKLWEKYLINKLKINKDFFLHGLNNYLFLLKDFNRFITVKKVKYSIKDVSKNINKTLIYVQKLFPFYVVVYYICNHPDFNKYFIPLMDKITQARILSEGYYDKVDSYIKHLLQGKIENKYLKYYKILKEQEIKLLLAGKKVNLASLQIRNNHNYLMTFDNFIEGRIDFKKYLKENNYYYPLWGQAMRNQVKGQPIVEGRAIGQARVILNKQNLKSIKSGEILVTPMTSPDFVPYLKKVAAVVTDHGGILCHAAIACRELKKICVIGTGKATDVFKSGDLVEVDANKGIIRKLT